MTLRARLLAGFGGVVLVPLVSFGLRVRAVMASRLTEEYERRVAAQTAVIRADIARDGGAVAHRLDALKEAIAVDDRLRLALLNGGDRAYVLDYAGVAMRSAGLAMLVIQDAEGRVVSSGHFRNAYDRLEPALPRALATVEGGVALVEARTPEAPLLTIARVDSFRLASRPFTVVGGLAIDPAGLVALTPDPELAVTVALPTDTVAADTTVPAVVRDVSLPFVREGDSLAIVRPARVLVRHSLASLATLRHDVDRTFLAAVVIAGVVALVLAVWLSWRISSPLAALARKTTVVDLDRLDVAFASDRGDEVGALSRVLGAMVERLRAGAERLRETERRLAMGELARQVNHDVKNGLTPIRNVVRHLLQVASGEPDRLAAVLREREPTLESSIAYLEHLAGTYARLYPASTRGMCDTAQVIRETVSRLGGRAGATDLGTELVEPLPPTATEALVLRRILENLVGNALDALDGKPGTVRVAAAPGPATNGTPTVRITVSDTGRGMTRSELDRAFEGFYSTKPGGTGLGLAIVRRLVLDANGALRVETEPGAGSRFMVELPGGVG